MRSQVTFIISIFLIGSLAAEPQTPPEEFMRDKDNMTATTFTLTEDSEDEYQYIVYKDQTEKRKIRYIWNGGCCDDPIIEDAYFKDKKLLMIRELKIGKENLTALQKGENGDATVIRDLYFNESQLSKWIEGTEEKTKEDIETWTQVQNQALNNIRQSIKTYAEYKKFEEPL